jgi:hypothetical protein
MAKLHTHGHAITEAFFQLRLWIQMADLLFGFCVHPETIIPNVISEPLRGLPLIKFVDFGVHGLPSAPSRRLPCLPLAPLLAFGFCRPHCDGVSDDRIYLIAVQCAALDQGVDQCIDNTPVRY